MMIAYIDPGMGALLWQMIVAAFVGFLFYLKQTRRWIVGLIMGMFRKPSGRGPKPLESGGEFPPPEAEAKINIK